MTARRVPLAAVIVTHRSEADVGTALESVLEEAPPGTPVYVVDEASADGTVERARSFAEVRVLAEPTNRGFAAGVRRAVAACAAERWLLLNPDAWLEEGALEDLESTLRADPGALGACPLVLRPEPDGSVDSLGIGISRGLAPFSIASGLSGDGEFAAGEVFGFHGAAALLCATVLEDLGGLDEGFFCYQEEFDLSWRVRRAGGRFLAVPSARVRHKVAASSLGRRAWREYHLERNRLWAVAKNATRDELVRSAHGLVAGEVSAWRYGLAGHAPWVLAARRDALAGLGRVLRARREFERSHPGLLPVAAEWMGLKSPRC